MLALMNTTIMADYNKLQNTMIRACDK